MNHKPDIETRLAAVAARIADAARRAGRSPAEIAFVAVTKTQPAETVRQAIEAGAAMIGENYIQEAREKFDALVDQTVQWHFIGHLQHNKAKYAVRMFHMIHSVDSLRLAREIDKQAEKIGKKQTVLIQINVSGETSKSGVDRNAALALIEKTAELPNLRLQGLMTLPPFFDAPERARPFFAQLRRLRDHAAASLHIDLPHLSMGMTGDFEVAVQEGATLVRIGTAIFGERG